MRANMLIIKIRIKFNSNNMLIIKIRIKFNSNI